MSQLPAWPAWIDSLRDDLSALGFIWLDEETRAAQNDLNRVTWEQIPYEEFFSAACRARASRSIAIAVAATERASRLGDRQALMALYYDPERDALFASLADHLPPPLWVPLGRDAAAIAAALAPYRDAEWTDVRRFSRSLRLFRGTLPELGLDSVEELVRIIGESESWLDTATWQNGCETDPWPADATSLPAIELRGLMARSREETTDRFRSTSFRTLWSRSVLRVEEHPFAGVVFELRYEPIRQPSVHAEFAALFPDLRLPDDVPVDLLASILRGMSLSQPFLDRLLATEPLGSFAGLAQCALAPADPASVALLRRLLAQPEDRAAALQLADAYGMRSLRREVLAETDDADERAQLLHELAPWDSSAAADEGDEDDEDEDDDQDEESAS